MPGFDNKIRFITFSSCFSEPRQKPYNISAKSALSKVSFKMPAFAPVAA